MKKQHIPSLIILAIFLLIGLIYVQNTSSAAVASPRSVCQTYLNLGITVAVDKNTENDCYIKIGNNDTGFGTVHAYYTTTPAEFCIESSGAYFPKSARSCTPISSAGKVQPDSKPGKLITSSNFQIRELQYNTLPTGKQITAGDKERIEVIMPDGSIIQLDAKATFTPVSDYEVQSMFGRFRYMWQPFHDGKCIVGQSLARQECRKVKTRDAVLGITGTEFLVETNESGTTVTVIEGSLAVSDLNYKKTIDVAGGQSTYIKHGGLPEDPKSFDATKLERWWGKKYSEQVVKIIAFTIIGFVLSIVILFMIREKILKDKQLALGQPQTAKTILLIIFIIIFGIMVILALSEMGYVNLPKIDLSFLKNK